MKFINRFVLAFLILALSTGCVALDQVATNIQEGTDSAMMVLEICKAAKENVVNANAAYAGKDLTLTAKVSLIEEKSIGSPRYSVLFRLEPVGLKKPVYVFADTDDQAGVSKLKEGNTGRVSGVFDRVSYRGISCDIWLKDVKY